MRAPAPDLPAAAARPDPQLALEILIGYASPKMGESCPSHAVARCERWLEAALRIPCGTDDEAHLFVEAATSVRHHVTEGVLARYRTLIVDRRFKKSALRVLGSLGEIQRLAMCAAPETQAAVKVILLDELRNPIDHETRERAAYAVPGIRRMWSTKSPKPDPLRPASPSLLLELSRLALEPSATPSSRPALAESWRRLYVYVGSACEAMDDPPFRIDRQMRPEEDPVERLISQYRAWFDAHRQKLEAEAAAEAAELDRARERLVSLEAR